jgi:hypothetical protein
MTQPLPQDQYRRAIEAEQRLAEARAVAGPEPEADDV